MFPLPGRNGFHGFLNGRIRNYEEDLGEVLDIRTETTEVEEDLPSSHTDIRRLEWIRDREPTLQQKIIQLRNETAGQSERIQASTRRVNVSKALIGDYDSLISAGGHNLREAKRLVDKIKNDLSSHLGLPVSIFDEQTHAAFLRFVQDPGNLLPQECFSTDDPGCRKLLEDAGVEPHRSGHGWQVGQVAALLLNLRDAAAKAKDEVEQNQEKIREKTRELEVANEKVVEAERSLEQERDKMEVQGIEAQKWRREYDDLTQDQKVPIPESEPEQDTGGREQLKLVEDLAAEKEEMNEKLQRANAAIKEKEKEIVGLRKELVDYEANEGIEESLLKKVSQLDLRVQEAEQELEGRDVELKESETTRRDQTKDLEKLGNDVRSLQGTVRNLLAHVADPSSFGVDLERLRPYLEKESTLHDVKMPDGPQERSPTMLANWYPDEEDRQITFPILQIVARGVGIPLSPLDGMAGALALERQLLPATAEGSTAVSIAYQFALTEGANPNFRGAAFAVLCVALEELNRQYPRGQALHWWETLQSMMKRRYTIFVPSEPAPLMEQLCVYRLGLTVEAGLGDVKAYCPTVASRVQEMLRDDDDDEEEEEEEADLIDHLASIHISEAAAVLFSDQEFQSFGGVLEHEESGIDLVAMHDSEQEYLFWRRPESPVRVLSTAGFRIGVEASVLDRSSLVVTPACASKLASEAPSFRFVIAKKKCRVREYVGMFHLDETVLAWRCAMEDALEGGGYMVVDG